MPWVGGEDWGRARRKHAELRKVVVRIIGVVFLTGMLFGGLT